jgi:hypothetical protein
MVVAFKKSRWVIPGFYPEVILNNFLKKKEANYGGD